MLLGALHLRSWLLITAHKTEQLQTLLTYPTFLVIGAQKCGTSWLSHMMSQHPEVSTGTEKELHFFNKIYNYQKGLEWYKSQFSITSATKAVGEFTPNYFWTSEEEREIRRGGGTRKIPKLVHEAYPNLKLIVCLRDPVDRAVSAYYHHINMGRVQPKQSLMEVADCYGIKSMGYYDIHLSNWMNYYTRENFLVLIYEEDLQDKMKRKTLERVFRYIGVDSSFEPNGIFFKYNVRTSHLDMRFRHFPFSIGKVIGLLVPERIKKSKMWKISVLKKEKETLMEIFKPHNKNLEEIIGRRLPWK
jgi:hypothetical protein